MFHQEQQKQLDGTVRSSLAQSKDDSPKNNKVVNEADIHCEESSVSSSASQIKEKNRKRTPRVN